ncbi:hypothetical protein JTB14_007306 [Gonioctena quinquepunctata]|nr:hypothetical protein JTB14_007306 [Gonioctena quinquepunctata]
MHYDDDRVTGKPEIIIDYNKTEGDVDVVDKMCEACNCARATRRWQMVIIYSALNVPGINNNIIYDSNTRTKIKTMKFLEEVGFQFLDMHIRRRAQQQLVEICGLETENIITEIRTYGRCTFCSTEKVEGRNIPAKSVRNICA